MRAVFVFMALIATGLAVSLVLPNRSPDTTTTPILQPYEPSFITLWIEGCVSSGETEGFCECAIDEYTARLEPHEFETAAAVAQSGGRLAELPEHLREVVKAVEHDCR
jgi:hypothetical protein